MERLDAVSFEPFYIQINYVEVTVFLVGRLTSSGGIDVVCDKFIHVSTADLVFKVNTCNTCVRRIWNKLVYGPAKIPWVYLDGSMHAWMFEGCVGVRRGQARGRYKRKRGPRTVLVIQCHQACMGPKTVCRCSHEHIRSVQLFAVTK